MFWVGRSPPVPWCREEWLIFVVFITSWGGDSASPLGRSFFVKNKSFCLFLIVFWAGVRPIPWRNCFSWGITEFCCFLLFFGVGGLSNPLGWLFHAKNIVFVYGFWGEGSSQFHGKIIFRQNNVVSCFSIVFWFNQGYISPKTIKILIIRKNWKTFGIS